MNNLNLKNNSEQISNGRINILGPNSDVLFSMSDKIPVDSKNYSCREVMNGNWYDTELSNAFFSAKNMQILQNGIRAGVYQKSNQQYVVGEQNMDELQIIMRGLFLQYAKNQPSNIAQQIYDLNKIVLNFSIDQVWSEAEGYMKYKRDASTMWTPLNMPILSYSNDKQLELKKWF
jgi:hypothetical protein